MFNSAAKDLCPCYHGGWGHFPQWKFAKKVDKFWHHCQVVKDQCGTSTLVLQVPAPGSRWWFWGLHQKSGKSGVGDWAPTVR